MKDTRPVAQQVADLTPKQKSSILWTGIVFDVIGIIALVVALVCFILPPLNAAVETGREADEIYDEISEENDRRLETGRFDLLEYDQWDDLCEEREAHFKDFFTAVGIFFGCMLLYLGLMLLYLKVKLPYYSDGKFFYILFAKLKGTE